MNIVFDFEETETPVSATTEATEAIAGLREFARHKLGELQDEIDKYQEGLIILCVLGTIETTPFGVAVFNYPEDLTDKIKASFTDDDLAYIKSVMEAKVVKAAQ